MKHCTGGATTTVGRVRNSKAYCEGVQARIDSNSPTNPHEVGSEASDCWLAGVADAAAKAGSTVVLTDAPCCAPTHDTVPV